MASTAQPGDVHPVPHLGSTGRGGPRIARRRRVLLSDARDNGRHLRTTWHPNRGVFVVSTWVGDVCTGSVQIPAADVAALTSLLVDGLADFATTRPTVEAGPGSRSGNRVAARLRTWLSQGWGRRRKPQRPTASVHLLNVRTR